MNATQALVVVQVAISLLLLVTAGLFVRTLSNLQSIDVGFNRDNVLLFEVNASQAGYTHSAAASLLCRFASPNVGDAGRTRRDAVARLAHQRRQKVADQGERRQPTDHRILQIGPAFFSTMQIPVLSWPADR